MPSVKFTAGALRDLARLRAFLQHKNPMASPKSRCNNYSIVQIIKQHPQIG